MSNYFSTQIAQNLLVIFFLFSASLIQGSLHPGGWYEWHKPVLICRWYWVNCNGAKGHEAQYSFLLELPVASWNLYHKAAHRVCAFQCRRLLFFGSGCADWFYVRLLLLTCSHFQSPHLPVQTRNRYRTAVRCKGRSHPGVHLPCRRFWHV